MSSELFNPSYGDGRECKLDQAATRWPMHTKKTHILKHHASTNAATKPTTGRRSFSRPLGGRRSGRDFISTRQKNRPKKSGGPRCNRLRRNGGRILGDLSQSAQGQNGLGSSQ